MRLLDTTWDRMQRLYLEGQSLPQVAQAIDVPVSTVRRRLRALGLVRSRTEGLRLAADSGRLGAKESRKGIPLSDAHKAAIAVARQRWADENSNGTSLKSSGYVVFTSGPDKHRGVHTVVMENRLGRRILDDEHVHHIDGNRSNNEIDNLALVTKVGHARIHRREEQLERLGKGEEFGGEH